MLLAYIDEIGEPGAFVSRNHPRFRTSPAFGYAGFIIPSRHARAFGAIFQHQKNTLFKAEVEAAERPSQWERKGADLFSKHVHKRHPQHLRVFDHLVRKVREFDGSLFYYADEKPIGTAKQVAVDPEDRERDAMSETLNRIARHSDYCGQNVMVMIDQINETTRAKRLPNMYGHILGRAAQHQEMRSIVEPPMHVDSQLSANIQFADWVAAAVTRAIDYQLIENSYYSWVTDKKKLKTPFGAFTHESKLHLHHRSVSDLNHSEVFSRERKLYPTVEGFRVGSSISPEIVAKLRGRAEK
ncbi:DUF3800 domain-containing protein [Gulosibacter faecalis]|uniref:DUF3800 domain-containing protein n=1 Tax=Gulosibacter faecalis TaxID=272240 RepID=A0ABW5V124_9MICO|nr:DUF3800 domain-containing protein [Gulosibacter faecalis]